MTDKNKPVCDEQKTITIVNKDTGEEIKCTVEQFVQACNTQISENM